ncbi:MAG: hypothetical protein ACSHX5_01860 [Phycisphaerales bacterium]
MSAAHSSDRDDVFQIARSLVREEWDLFVRAGQQIDEIYCEELVGRDDEIPLGPCERYAAEETFEFLRFKRLATAVQCFRYPQNHEFDNHLDFESNAPVEERKQSARRAILVMLAAADPEKGQVITDEMGVLANTPYEIEGDGELPEFGGSSWIPWAEDGWDEQNEPSPSVLKRLRNAIDVVRYGSVQAARQSRIPTGDGRPCDEPGLNRFDEAERSVRDVMRFVQHFVYCLDQHWKDWRYRYEEATRIELDAIRLENRNWWAKWSGVLMRAREAIRVIDLPEIAGAKQAAFDALTIIHDEYQEPVFYSDHEQPGDHILRAAMNRGQDQVIADRRARLNQAFKDLEPLCRGCRLYIDQPPKGDQTADLPDPDSEQQIEAKPKSKRRSEQERRQDDLAIAQYLADHPEATRNDLVSHTGLSAGTISQSPAWKRFKLIQKNARKEARPEECESFDSFADPDSAQIRSSDGGRASSMNKIKASNARRN